jgi:hypothetical protein
LIRVRNKPFFCENQALSCEFVRGYSQRLRLSTEIFTGVYTSFIHVIQVKIKGLTGLSTLSTGVNNVVN